MKENKAIAVGRANNDGGSWCVQMKVDGLTMMKKFGGLLYYKTIKI